MERRERFTGGIAMLVGWWDGGLVEVEGWEWRVWGWRMWGCDGFSCRFAFFGFVPKQMDSDSIASSRVFSGNNAGK